MARDFPPESTFSADSINGVHIAPVCNHNVSASTYVHALKIPNIGTGGSHTIVSTNKKIAHADGRNE